jgi:AmiR/NasT family two-component response regulator
VRGTRRFSQAISEGDGISLLVDVDGPEAARRAEADGAEALVVRGAIAGLGEATGLPILWCAAGPLEEARRSGADAYLIVSSSHDLDELGDRHREALEAGLDCVVAVADEDELERVLETVDPEIFLLSTPGDHRGADALERVLELLPDVPAGKLAIAEVTVSAREQVDELERAGFDAVLVGAGEVAGLAGGAPPEV